MMRFLRTITGNSRREAESREDYRQKQEEVKEIKHNINCKLENIERASRQIEAGARLMKRLRKDFRNGH